MARGQALAANSTYGEQWWSLNDLCANARIEGSAPRVLDEETALKLAALISVASAERVAIASPLADARRLRTEIDSLQREHDALGEAIETITPSIDQRRSEFHAAQLKTTEYTVQAAGLAERLISIRRESRRFLLPLVWPSMISRSMPPVLALRYQQSRRSMPACANRLANLK